MDSVNPAMIRHASYLHRLIATGFSFVVFGIGGVLLRYTVFPILYLLVSDRLLQRRYSRRVVSGSFRMFVEMMRALGVLEYRVHGIEKLGKPGQLIIANHPSLIDVVFMIAFIPDANCVIKSSLKRNPFMYGPVTAAQYVENDPAAEMIEQSCAQLNEGQTLILFPEGTRTIPQQPLQFHRSAAHIAIQAATKLTPVIIRVHPTTLTKAEPWYRIPPKRVIFSMDVRDDIDLEPYRKDTCLPRTSRALNAFLLDFFNQEIASHGSD
ncbi:acyltransferase family protein [gamma proteobacterium HdN1]|nr:acyltransferase family protein [gamma proteobacterium HdN1]